MPDQTAKTETLEDAIKKNAPKLDGFELERVIPLPKQPDVNPLVQIYIPFSPESDYTPADPYKAAVDAIAPQDLEEKYKLLASVRKLADHYKASAVLVDLRYAQIGIDDFVAKHQEDAANLKEQLKDHPAELERKLKEVKEEFKAQLPAKVEELKKQNAVTYQKDIDTIEKNVNSAWANAEYTPKIMPADYKFSTTKYGNLESDVAGRVGNARETIGSILAADHKHRDTNLKNFEEGTRMYVLKYEQVKDKDGNEGIMPAAVEVWKKKEAA